MKAINMVSWIRKISKLLKFLIPSKATFISLQWIFLPMVYIIIGGIFELFFPRSLLVASLLSVAIFIGGFLKAVYEKVRSAREVSYERISWGYPRFYLWLMVIVAILIFYYLLMPPIIDFLLYLIDLTLKEPIQMSTIFIYTFAAISGLIVFGIVLSYLSDEDIKKFNEKRLEFGGVGAVLLSIADIIVFIQGMRGVSVHYPFFYMVALRGMLIAFFCLILTWITLISILVKGMKRKGISHLIFSITFGTYAGTTVIYASSELLGLWIQTLI